MADWPDRHIETGAAGAARHPRATRGARTKDPGRIALHVSFHWGKLGCDRGEREMNFRHPAMPRMNERRRVAGALARKPVAKHVGAAPWLYLREWVDIQPWTEFRCFMVDRKIAGISEWPALLR